MDELPSHTGDQNQQYNSFHHITKDSAMKLVWLTGTVTESGDLIQSAIKKSTALFIPDWISKTDLHHFILLLIDSKHFDTSGNDGLSTIPSDALFND